MLANYVKIALRNLVRQRGSTVVNLLGLAVGMACALLVFLFVRAERSYDRFYEEADRVYRVTYEEVDTPAMRHLATISPPMGPALVEEYPEIVATVRLRDSDRHLLAHGERRFYEDTFFYADSTFFELFGFPLAAGDPATALVGPDRIVLTQEKARAYFGDEDPMGKTMRFDDERVFTVTGVLAPLPGRTHLRFDFLLSFSTFRVPRGYPVTLESWGWISFHTYVKLAPGADAGAVEAKLPGFMERHFDADRARDVRLRLQPVADVYLGQPKHTFIPSGNPLYLYGLSGMAVLILLLSCFNFTNLATVHSIRRSREAGVRKVLGAARLDLVRQFLGESVLAAGLGMVLAFVFVEAGLALLGTWLGGDLGVTARDYLGVLPYAAGLAVLLGVVGGAYPAFVVSGLQPAQVLKGGRGGGTTGAAVRRVLVVLQFAIAVVLVVGSLIVLEQMRFVRDKDLGFDREQVVALHVRGEDLLPRYAVVKERLLQNPNVVGVTRSGHLFDGYQGSVPIFPEGGEDEEVRAMNIYGVHYDFVETLGIDVVAGRAHDEAHPADSARGILLNEAAARYFAATTPGWDDPLGRTLRVGEIIEGEVIGVVENFHFASLHDEVAPLVLYIPPTVQEHVLVRVRPGAAEALLASLRRDWEAVAPDLPFDYSFLDERIQRLYEEESRFFRLAAAFALLAIFIAGLGLYGLVAFVTQLRTKEIGIRKVLGASVPGLVGLLSKPFLIYVLAANLIAWPVAYAVMQAWLENFAYRVAVGPGPFVAAGLLALVVAQLTMSRESIRAARANPVETLRTE